MGGFHDLSVKEQELAKKEGINIGFLLQQDRQLFLKKTTVQNMRRRKFQREFDDLFNHPENIDFCNRRK